MRPRDLASRALQEATILGRILETVSSKTMTIKGGRAIVGSFSWFVQHHAIGLLQGSWVVAVSQERTDKVSEERGACPVNHFPYPEGDGLQAGSRIARGAGERLSNFPIAYWEVVREGGEHYLSQSEQGGNWEKVRKQGLVDAFRSVLVEEEGEMGGQASHR